MCIVVFILTMYNGRRDIFLRENMFDKPSKVFSILANTGSLAYPEMRSSVSNGSMGTFESMGLVPSIETVDLNILDKMENFTPLDHPSSHMTTQTSNKPRYVSEIHKDHTSVDNRRDEFTSERVDNSNLWNTSHKNKFM